MSRARDYLPSHCTAKGRTLAKWEREGEIWQRRRERGVRKKKYRFTSPDTCSCSTFAAVEPFQSIAVLESNSGWRESDKSSGDSSHLIAQGLGNFIRLGINEQMEPGNRDSNKQSAGVFFLCRKKNKITSTVMKKKRGALKGPSARFSSHKPHPPPL